MTGEAIVAKLTNVESIDGADAIQKAKVFGETVIISIDHKEGDLGVLFDCETQLSGQFTRENNLFRDATLNLDRSKTGYMDSNRRVRPIKLKGVKCSGLWMPIECLNFTGGFDLEAGQQFTELNKIPICKKYVRQGKSGSGGRNRGPKPKQNLVPTFREHMDTDQLMRNLHYIQPESLITVTEKLHGTSCRVGNLPVVQKQSWWDKLWGKPVKTKYGHVVGSRRVLKSAENGEVPQAGSYYNTDVWTDSAERFKGKLEKGETVYYEIVGYLPAKAKDGVLLEGSSLIMGSQSNSKLKKFMEKSEYKDFVEKYGDTTKFTYGCGPGEYKVYVYRMTFQNEDGHCVDYTWDQVKTRCEQMDVPHVPQLRIGENLWNHATLVSDMNDGTALDNFSENMEGLANMPSENFPQQLREGVVVRVDNGGMEPKLLKHKAWAFKCLEGIIKDAPNHVDLEESQSET